MNTTKGNEMTDQVELQLVKSGQQRPVWFVNVKVDGRSVEMVQLTSKRQALPVMADLANKYR